MRRLLNRIAQLIRGLSPSAWLFGHKYSNSPTGQNFFFRPGGVSLPSGFGVPESAKVRRPWWWLRIALRWTFTAFTVIAAATTAFRVLSVLRASPPNPTGGARESEASAELWVGGFFTLLIGAGAVVFWILEWTRSDRVQPAWECKCGYDRRGLAPDTRCPECGTVPHLVSK